MLSIKHISKSYVQRGKVLDGLSLDVNAGDSISIMGPSGSGKTTLLNIIGLLDRPDEGIVNFQNRSISGFNDDEAASYRNKNIGFVFQEHLLLPHLTVAENISLPLLAAGLHPDEMESRKKHVSLLMEKTGITSLTGKYPFRISGGEAQRVALVRALANKPSILLADEPTGSLDEKNAEMLANLITDINRDFGITVIIATHSLQLSRKMSRQLTIQSGKLV